MGHTPLHSNRYFSVQNRATSLTLTFIPYRIWPPEQVWKNPSKMSNLKKKNFASCKDNIQVLYLFGNGIKIGSRWFNSYFDSIQYVWEIAIRRFWPPILLEIASGTWRDLVFKARNDFNAFFRSLCKTTNILSPLLRSENFFQIGATLFPKPNPNPTWCPKKHGKVSFLAIYRV